MSDPLGRRVGVSARLTGSLPNGWTVLSPRVQRLLWLGAFSILSVLTGPRLLAPIALGWERAERALALEDELANLRREHVALQREIAYRRTPAGQALTAAEVLGVTYPHARAVELIPRPESAASASQPTLAERIKAWREAGRACLHRKWRVLNLFLLGRHVPPPQSS